jgi:hypothetical protein
MKAEMKDDRKTVDLDDVDALGHDEELAMLVEALPALEEAYEAYNLCVLPVTS